MSDTCPCDSCKEFARLNAAMRAAKKRMEAIDAEVAGRRITDADMQRRARDEFEAAYDARRDFIAREERD